MVSVLLKYRSTTGQKDQTRRKLVLPGARTTLILGRSLIIVLKINLLIIPQKFLHLNFRHPGIKN